MLIYVQANANYNLKIGINRFDFESEIIQLLNRMKQKYRQSRLSEIKRKLRTA